MSPENTPNDNNNQTIPQTPAPTPAPSAAPTPAPTAIPLQQSPVQQPVQQPSPMQPYAQPAYNTVNSMSQSQSSSGNTKKTITLVAGLVALFVVAAGGFFAYKNFIKVSKADYKKAYDVSTAMRSAYSNMASEYISISSTEKEIANSVDTKNKSKSSFDEKYEELGTMKATKKDKNINEKYKALEEKKSAFDKSYTTTIEFYQKLGPVFIGLRDADKSDVIRKTITSMESIKLTESPNKEYLEKIKNKLQEIDKLSAQVEAGRADYKKYNSAAVSKFYDSITELSNILRDWGSDLDKMEKDGSVRDELNALDQALFDMTLKK